MGRVFKSNARWVKSLVGIVDEPARDLAATLAVYTNTSSPAARGAQPFGNNDLRGSGVNACDWQTAPIQRFAGVDVRTINQAGVNRAQGSLLSGSLPGADGLPTSSSLAWMSLGNSPGVGYGG